MKKLLFLFLVTCFLPMNNSHAEEPTIEEAHAGPSRSFSTIMKSVVTVRNPYGYGTGTLFEKRGQTYALTAAHVVKGPAGNLPVKIEHGDESKEAAIVYIDEESDIAILSLDRMESRSAYNFKFRRSDIKVGDLAGYCGFPNRRDLACFSGKISFIEPGIINLNSFAFGGASGSLVFDSKGRVLGVLSAIEVGWFYGAPAPLENIVWVKPISREVIDSL